MVARGEASPLARGQLVARVVHDCPLVVSRVFAPPIPIRVEGRVVGHHVSSGLSVDELLRRFA